MPHIKIANREDNSVQIIQITDTHIFADDESRFDDIDSTESLQKVLKLTRSSEQWPPDLMLVTGDLVHSPEKAAYKKLLVILQELDVPVFCLPGNHDDPDLMDSLLNSKNVSIRKELHCGEWLLLLLNSHIPGTHSGELADDELLWFRQKLNENQDKHILVALHHHPVSIESSWMDSMILKNHKEFQSVLEENRHIKMVIWGHIHQEFQSQLGEALLFGTPSTCVQFLPGASAYAIDSKTAGFRQINLFPDGASETNVSRIGANP